MSVDETVLLHLSDIHFRKGVSGGNYDLDADLRNELEHDTLRMIERLGNVQGILVTGDTAFGARKEEYEEAGKWIERLCAQVGCPSDFVWIVPGNHDVDRSVVSKSRTLQMYRQMLRTCSPSHIDNELGELMSDEAAREMLYRPLANYNLFAARYNCSIDADRPIWHQDLELNDGSSLRLLGLNSVLFSDDKDDDGANKLILGSLYALPHNKDGIEYVTLCHHPLDWLRDSDRLDQGFNARVRIQLFGHKHVLKADRINNTVRVVAGAVHPDRKESGWRPRYNFLSINTSQEGTERRLNATIYPRVWNDKEQEFGGDYNTKGEDWHSHSLPIRALRVRVQVPTELVATADLTAEESQTAAQLADVITGEPLPLEVRDTLTEGSPIMNKARRLTYRFLSLPYHDRIKVAQDLALLHDEDEGISEGELFKRFFRRAKEQHLLARLWQQVEVAHGEGIDQVNPFEESNETR